MLFLHFFSLLIALNANEIIDASLNDVEMESNECSQCTETRHADNVPRYLIECTADVKEPHFFKTLSTEQLLEKHNYDAGERIFGYDFEIYDDDKGFEPISYSFRGINNHYIAALHAAFMYHLPFQIRPDDLWIIIAQGIATHIFENAEILRRTFVDFDGKKEIKVRDDRLDINSKTNDWLFVLEQFAVGCINLTNNDIVNLITADFSTTSITSQTASQIVLFKAMSKYIDFTTMTMSGIPQIQLIGSIDDWKKIKSKCKQIESMNIGLDFWLKYLYSVIDHIIETIQVLNHKEILNKKLIYFWDSIYQYQSGSGGPSISGWIKTLFPYIFARNATLIKNHELKWDYSDDKYREWAEIAPGSFPGSYSKCPMKWEYFDSIIHCGMYGGIFGIAQQKNTGCIAPIIGWIIAGK